MARGTGRRNRASGTFGAVDKLATGYRARYFGPDGRRYKADTLFLTKAEARSWLVLRHAEIVRRRGNHRRPVSHQNRNSPSPPTRNSGCPNAN
jgi:hypothetical protein